MSSSPSSANEDDIMLAKPRAHIRAHTHFPPPYTGFLLLFHIAFANGNRYIQIILGRRKKWKDLPLNPVFVLLGCHSSNTDTTELIFLSRTEWNYIWTRLVQKILKNRVLRCVPLNKIHKHFSKDCLMLFLHIHPAFDDLFLGNTLSKPGLTSA